MGKIRLRRRRKALRCRRFFAFSRGRKVGDNGRLWHGTMDTTGGGTEMAEKDDLQARIAAAARPLTDRQRAFVLEYLRDLNGTQAAIRAGYAEDRAASTASRLLRKPEIRAFRDVLMEERFEAVGITRYNLKGALKALEMLGKMLPETAGKDDDTPAGLEALLMGGDMGGGREF